MEQNEARRSVGPNPGATTTSALVVVILGAVVLAAGSGGALASSPLDGVTASEYARHAASATWSGFLTLGASIPLAVSTATIANRQQRLGVRVPGPVIGLVGGVVAAVSLAVSGGLTWALGVSGGAGAATQAVAACAFVTGGVGFAMSMGLLCAGLAVPCLVLRLTPRWFAWIGLVLAVLAELSWFSMLVPALDALLPLARFGSLVWVAAAGFLLPSDRRQRVQRSTRR